MRPLIGIPPCLDDRGRWKPGQEVHYIGAAYASALESAGASPIYLPLQGAPASLIRRIDGLLVPGGDDLPPDRPYPATVGFDLAPDRQVAFDRGLLAEALARELPVLAICYGMQILALECGGSLHFDVPSDVPDADLHKAPAGDAYHGLRIQPGTGLAALLDGAPPRVNSRHHQAVATPGAHARVAALADDGLIEAIETTGPGFAIGVQWHPETLDGPHREGLFGGFVEACRRSGRPRG